MKSYFVAALILLCCLPAPADSITYTFTGISATGQSQSFTLDADTFDANNLGRSGFGFDGTGIGNTHTFPCQSDGFECWYIFFDSIVGGHAPMYISACTTAPCNSHLIITSYYYFDPAIYSTDGEYSALLIDGGGMGILTRRYNPTGIPIVSPEPTPFVLIGVGIPLLWYRRFRSAE